MSTKDISKNNEKEVNVMEKTEEKGVILEKDLNPVNLIIKDNEELKEMLSKKFSDLTMEEKKKLPTAKVRIVNKRDFFNKNQRYIRILFADGVYFERQLNETNGEGTLLKLKYPKLFEIPKRKEDIVYIDVPVRLYSYLKEDGTFTYQFSAEVYPGILMRGNKVRKGNTTSYRNYFNQLQLELLMLNDTKYKFILLDGSLMNEDELEEEFEN